MLPKGGNTTTSAFITDGDWMMIHCDTFISDRERILLKQKAFMIDRDFALATPHLANGTTNHDFINPNKIKNAAGESTTAY